MYCLYVFTIYDNLMYKQNYVKIKFSLLYLFPCSFNLIDQNKNTYLEFCNYVKYTQANGKPFPSKCKKEGEGKKLDTKSTLI